jgi:outer membrane protein assembly factor BamD (BamD/ComL family)
MTMKNTRHAAPSELARLTDGGGRTADELAVAALLAKVPPVTPDDVAAERVWRRVVAKDVRDSGASRWLAWARIGALPALAIVGVVLALVLRPASSLTAELTLSSGGVFSGKLADKWRPSQTGEPLAEAERIRTDRTGHAVLRVSGVAAVLVGEESDVGLERLHHGTVLRLSHGTLTARVSKRSADEPFVVETDRYTVKVVGTLFAVEQGPGDHTAVSVREGIVEVSDGHGRVDRVVAGERWVSEARDARSPDRTPNAVKALLEDGLAGKASAELGGSFAAAIAAPAHASTASPLGSPSTGPSAVPAATQAASSARGAWTEVPAAKVESAPTKPHRLVEPEQPGPAVFAPMVPAPTPPEPVNPAPVVRASPSAESRDPVVVASAVVAPPGSPSGSPLAPGAPVDEGPYARGLAFESKGDFTSAARELSRAAADDPAHGDIALYALGRLEQRRRHDPSRARAAFIAYRDRYPRGPLLPEVDLAILEIEVDTHAQTEALADSARFLAAHPGSERLDEVHALRGNLLRDADRCREAMDDYAKVHAAPWTDHALYSTAYCQRKLGDRIAAAATLRDYLTRFPAGAHRAEAERALAEE